MAGRTEAGAFDRRRGLYRAFSARRLLLKITVTPASRTARSALTRRDQRDGIGAGLLPAVPTIADRSRSRVEVRPDIRAEIWIAGLVDVEDDS
jgi:hypothetical protein